MPQKTNAQLELENSKLQDEIDGWYNRDEQRRKTFSELLGAKILIQDTYFNAKVEEKPKLCDWIEIAFRIGELKNKATWEKLIKDRVEKISL